METSRARRRLVSSVAVLLFAASLLTFHLGREDGGDAAEAEGRGQTRDNSWPKDVVKACSTPVDDPEIADKTVRAFYASGPEAVAQTRTEQVAVVVLESTELRQVALCHGLRDNGTEPRFSTAVFPLRDAPRGSTVLPFGDYSVAGVHSVVVRHRMPAQATRAVIWLGDGRKVSLVPQEERWLAAVLEVNLRSQDEEPVRRFRYMSADDEVLGEWVAPGIRRNPRVPPLEDAPGLDTRESTCLSC